MDLKELKILKAEDDKITYDCDKVNFLVRKKGSISGDHVHNVEEKFYLVSGDVELPVGSETKVVKAPLKITIQPKEYHKLVALTDFTLIEDRVGE